MGGANTSAGSMLTNNLVVMLTRAGQIRRAMEVYARATAAGPVANTTLAINYAKLLVEVGRPREAEAVLDGALKEKARLGDQRGEAFGLLAAASAACARRDIARCESWLAKAEQVIRAVFPPGYSTFASVEAMRGEIATLRRQRAEAVTHLERAVKMYDAAPDRNLLVIRALSMLATARQRARWSGRARRRRASRTASGWAPRCWPRRRCSRGRATSRPPARWRSRRAPSSTPAWGAVKYPGRPRDVRIGGGVALDPVCPACAG